MSTVYFWKISHVRVRALFLILKGSVFLNMAYFFKKNIYFQKYQLRLHRNTIEFCRSQNKLFIGISEIVVFVKLFSTNEVEGNWYIYHCEVDGNCEMVELKQKIKIFNFLVERKWQKFNLNNVSKILPAVLDLWETILIEEWGVHSHSCMYFDENTNHARS